MNNLLSKQIIPGKGVGNIKLDTHVNEIYEVLKQISPKVIEVHAFFPQIYVYTISESLSIHINILTGLVVRIDLFHIYKGTTPQNIGIGSSVDSLINIYDDLFFDESYLLIGKDSEMIIKINSNDQIVDLESIKSNVIEQITIEKKSWR